MSSYQQRKARWRAHPLPPDDPRHGTVNGYNNCFCRCARCRAAWAAYHGQYAQSYREQHAPLGASCKLPGCERRVDRAYVTGYCHRHNIERGLKPAANGK